LKSIGINLSNDDLKAIEKLFKYRWSASIRNWKERNVGGCQWIVECPDRRNVWQSETGIRLSDTINKLLERIGEGRNE
tara:strand:+ start:2684 stop:2917 length:234 start_codon:yes stop_codon:yes gene_type:complete